MNLDDYTVIVFCRNNLEKAQEDIQTDHACFQLGVKVGGQFGNLPGITWLISKEKLTTKGLRKLIAHCESNGLLHYSMLDTDVDPLNPTSVALMLLNDDPHKDFFRKYPLRNYSLGSANADLSLRREQGSQAPVAQAEHPVSNGEVGGSIPSRGSNYFCEGAD